SPLFSSETSAAAGPTYLSVEKLEPIVRKRGGAPQARFNKKARTGNFCCSTTTQVLKKPVNRPVALFRQPFSAQEFLPHRCGGMAGSLYIPMRNHYAGSPHAFQSPRHTRA